MIKRKITSIVFDEISFIMYLTVTSDKLYDINDKI